MTPSVVLYYHTNYGVIQGFPALREGATIQSKHLTRSLRSLVSYQDKQPERNSISTRAMYYSLYIFTEYNECL